MRDHLVLDALFLRPLVRRPWRFAITVVGVAAGVASLVATLAASRAALYALQQGVTDIAGAARVEVHNPGGVDEAFLGKLVAVARDAVICPVIEEIVLCPKLGDSVRLLGLDLAAESDVRTVRVTGEETGPFEDTRERSPTPDMSSGSSSAPTPDSSGGPARTSDADSGRSARLSVLRGEGAYISQSLAQKLALSVGDSIELDVHARPVRLSVSGVFTTPDVRTAWERAVVVDVARAQELVGRIGRLDRIDLAPRLADLPLASLEARVAPLLPAGYALVTPEDRRAQTDGMVRALEFNLNAISAISLFVAAVLVATTLATSVVQRRPTIALLMALGCGRAQIIGALLVEAAGIGVVGGGLGVGLGFLGARATLAAMRGTMATVIGGAPATPIRFETSFALIGLAAGVVAALCAVWLPLLEALRTPPIQALRSERPAAMEPHARRVALAVALVLGLSFVELSKLSAWNGLPIAALAGTLCLMGALVALCAPALDLLGRVASRVDLFRHRAVSGRLALAALSAGRRRAAWAAGAVGIAVALAVSIAAMVHSFRNTLIDWSAQGLRADLTLRPLSTETGVPLGRLDPVLVAIAEDVFGKDCVDPFYRAPAYLGGRRITLGGAAFEVIGRHGGVPLRDDRDSSAALAAVPPQHGLLVNEAFVHRFGLCEGDRVELEVRGGHIEREIAGVFFDYGDSQGLAVIDRADFLALYPDDGPREIAVFLPRESSVGDARRHLLGQLEGRFRIDVLDNSELKARVFAAFDRTFAITRTLQAVAAVVAVIAVFSVLSALVSERRADIGLLGALGASRAQITGLVVWQALVLGSIGSLGGSLCGLMIGLVLVDVVNLQSFGWTLAYHQPWHAIAAVIGSVLAACVLAAWIPAASAARSSLHDVLREED